ncbi:hypothetical protein Tco_0389387 [Tanacetum coccineum]
MQKPLPNNNYIPQPSFNQNYMQQPMINSEDISDPTTLMNMALVLMAKAFKRNYSTPTNNNQRISSNPCNRHIAQPVQNVRNQVVQNAVQNLAALDEGNGNGNNKNQIRCYNCRGMGHLARNYTVRPRRRDAAYLQTQLLTAQKEEARIQLQAKEFDLMATAGDIDEIEEVNANCILMANLQQVLTSGTQTDKAPIYDSDGLVELLDAISEPHRVQQNNSNVISAVSNVEQSRGTIEQNPATVEETRAYFDSLYNNLAIEVEKVNSVNRKLKETNAELSTELARHKNQEKFKREIAPKETTYVFLGYAQSGYRRYDVKSKRLDLMLRISLTLQAALLSIFCRLSACSADLRGFQSPGTACLFSAAITVSFPGSDYSIRSAV